MTSSLEAESVPLSHTCQQKRSDLRTAYVGDLQPATFRVCVQRQQGTKNTGDFTRGCAAGTGHVGLSSKYKEMYLVVFRFVKVVNHGGGSVQNQLFAMRQI